MPTVSKSTPTSFSTTPLQPTQIPALLSKTHNTTTPAFTAQASPAPEPAAGPETGSTFTTTLNTGMAGATGLLRPIQTTTLVPIFATRADAATPALPRPTAPPAPMLARGSSGSS